MSPVTNYYADTTFCIAFWQNVVIVDVGADIDVQHMKTLESSYRALLRSYPAGIAVLAILRAETPVASSGARNEAARFTKELGELLLKVAMVIEDRGILAQMLRSVIRGINVLVRQTRLVLFDSVEEALRTIAPLAIPATTRLNVDKELRAAVACVRATFRPAPRVSVPASRWF
jgi:hypothetical protein